MIKVYKTMTGMEQMSRKPFFNLSHRTESRVSKKDYKATGLKQIKGSGFSQNAKLNSDTHCHRIFWISKVQMGSKVDSTNS